MRRALWSASDLRDDVFCEVDMKKVGTKFAIGVGTLWCLFGAASLYRTWSMQRSHVEELTRNQAELALIFDLAIRGYVGETIRPEMERRSSDGEFVPETMSTSFVARSIFEKVRREFPDYMIKFSSENPRNTANLAGPEEKRIIRYFEEHPQETRWSGEIVMDGERYQAVFSPRRLKESCLRCHGNPEDAPESLLARYGSSAGFHRSVGEVAALDTVAIPTGRLHAAIAGDVREQLLITAALLSLMFGGVLFLFQRLVTSRLTAISSRFRRAVRGATAIEPVPVLADDEIGGLAASFNILAERLRQSYDTLEQQVEERTRELAEEVAQRRIAEESLRESEARFRALYESSSDAIMLLDRDGFFDCNDATLRIFGCSSKDEFCSKHPADLSPPQQPCGTDSLTLANERIETAIEQGNNRFEWMHCRKDGTVFPAEVLLNALDLNSHKVLQAVVRDISDRVRAVSAIRESEMLFRSMSSAAQDAIIMMDGKGDITFWNPSAQTIFGYSDEEAIGQNLHELLAHPQDRQAFRGAHPHFRKTGQGPAVGKTVELTAVRKDGIEIPVELSLSAVERGREWHAIGIARDIRNRKRVEKERERQRQTLSTIVDRLPVGVAIIDTQKRIRHVNPAAVSMMGCDSEEIVVGRLCHESFCPTERDKCPILDLGKTVDNCERVLIGKDAAQIPILKTVTPIQLSGEELLLEAFVDISERKAAEAERQRLQEKLIDSSRQAGMAEVATGVLHNVGNVLNSVNVSAQTATEKIKRSGVSDLARASDLIDEHLDDLGEFISTDERGKHLPRFLRELSRNLLDEQDSLVNELAAIGQNIEHIKEIVARQQSYATVAGVVMEASLSELADDALRTLEVSLTRHGIEIVREYPDQLQIMTDKHKVVQVLCNLVSNAKHALLASDSNEKRLVVRFKRTDADHVAVIVEDNGIGIAPENLSRVFQYGFTTKKNGHGFGLHSSALAAEELGGSLTAHSDGPGRGAMFTLELPLADQQPDDEPERRDGASAASVS